MKPSSTLLYLLIAWCFLGVLAFFVEEAGKLWNITGLLLAAILVVDFLIAFNSRKFTLVRKVNSNLPVSAWSKVKLTIENQNPRVASFKVFDHFPAFCQEKGLPISLRALPNQNVTFSYSLMPLHRGDQSFPGADLLITSPFGFWQLKLFVSCVSQVKVYPNFAAISKYSLLALDNRLGQLGVKKQQRRGEGNEFEQLREYREGDSLRQIDWNATACHGELISKEYEDERDQQIVFLIDCGRKMRVTEEGQAHLDQSLNAMLLLSYVASRQGDSVGFLAFAGADKWSAPRKGANAVNYLMNQCYDLNSSTHASDYLATAGKLMSLQGRRSLVILLSNTRGENQDDLVQAIKLMRRRHLVVFADLKEPGLSETLNDRVTDFESAMKYQSILGYFQRRKQSHESLSHLGAMCLDTTAKSLPLKLVNKYLEIKQSGRL